DPSVPLLERLKFLSIFSSNLDEFFMVRVAALKRRIHEGEQAETPDGLTPLQAMAAVSARVHELAAAQRAAFLKAIQPLLAGEGILLLRPKEITEEQRRFLEDYFRNTLLPVVTPLAVDPGHPFPYLGNRSLCLVASMPPSAPSGFPFSQLSIIHIPSQALPRFIALPDPDGKHAFMLLEDVIRLHLPTIYNGYEIVSSHAIRVTRDADLPDLPTRPADLLSGIERSLRQRRLGGPGRPAAPPTSSAGASGAGASAGWATRSACSTTGICPRTSWRSCSTSWSCRRETSTRARASQPS